MSTDPIFDDEIDQDEEPSASVKKFQNPIGSQDILPDDHLYYTYMKKVIRHRCRQSGFRRITTPIVEFRDVFEAGLGSESPVFTDEIFKLENEKGHELALKPEATTGIMRSYVQHNMKELPQPVELYYIEPHFRTRKPQKGFGRQFWQFGYEVIGEADPALDVQTILLSYKILEDLGIAHLFTLHLNHIGSQKSRAEYIEELKNFYIGKERALQPEDQRWLNVNPLRLLSSEDEDAKILAELAPKFENYRSKEDIIYYDTVKSYLDELGIKYVENEKWFGRFDYYTQTVFAFSESKENLNTVAGSGGRYDDLMERMGGPSTPAVGAAFAMERLIHHMKREKIVVPSKDQLHIFVAQLGDDAKRKCLNLIWELRDRGIKTVGALGKGSVKQQIQLASQFGVPYTLILGITEVRDGTIIIRDMAKGQQRTVPFDTVIDEVVKLIGEDNLDRYSPGELVFS